MRSNHAASKKHHILRGLPLTNSKHFYKNHNVRTNSIMLGCLRYSCKLKLRLEAMRREYMKLMALKKQYLHLLENTATEPMARVSSEDWFSMDACAAAQDQRDVDASVITQAILKALERQDY